MNEETLDKLIRQSCNEIAEEEYRELAHIGEGQEYVPSKRLQRKMRRLLRHHKINNAGYPGALPEEKTDDTIDAKIAEKTDEQTSKGRNKILHPIYWSKRTAVALLAVVVMAFGAMVAGARESVTWLNDHSFEFQDGFVKIRRERRTKYISPEKFVKAELTYVPEGYELKEEDYSREFGEYTGVYSNKEDELLYFMQMSAGHINFDLVSNGEQLEDIMINEYAGYYIPADEINSVLFCDKNFMYVVTGYFDKGELIKIAEGIENVLQ